MAKTRLEDLIGAALCDLLAARSIVLVPPGAADLFGAMPGGVALAPAALR